MTDFAQLGISVDTKELELAVKQLKQIQPAASGAAAAADKLTRSVDSMSVKLATASVRSAQAALNDAKATKAKMIASGSASKTDLTAATNAIKKAQADLAVVRAAQTRLKATLAETAAQKEATRVTDAATLAIRKQDATLNSLASRVVRGGGLNAANDQMPNRFNTANIAAQFQDIGVTAAMGMNPLTIALQQGTQLSAILNSMENPLKGIAVAFRSIINPVSLLSIGIVALIAAGVQLIDWVDVAKNGSGVLADAFVFLADNADILTISLGILGASIIAFNFTSIISGIAAATTAMIGFAASIGLVIAPFAAATAAAVAFGGLLYLIFGDNLIDAIRTGVNTGIGLIVGFVNTIGDVFKNASFAKLIFSLLVSPIELAFNTIKTSLNGYIAGINLLIEKLPEWVKNKTGVSKIDFKFEMSTLSADLFKEGASQIIEIGSKNFGESLGRDYVGGISKGIEQGLRGAADKLRISSKDATGIADKKSSSVKQLNDDDYLKLVNNTRQRITSLKAEQAALSLTAEQAARLRYETELFNDAQQKNIKLSPEQRTELAGLAAEMAAIEAQTKRTEEAMSFLSDTGKGFFDDMFAGLEEGKSLWQSFGDAVLNVLNKITDKLLDKYLDDAFSAFGATEGGGGFLQSIGDFLFSAKGNAFTPSGVEQFAKGSTFTNSIISSPTMFTFANGGKFGVMGEAGPEAVMPLKRGPDGSLGVALNGGMGGGNVTVNIINNGSSEVTQQQRQTPNGLEYDVIIGQVVSRDINRSGSDISRALTARDSRSYIRR